MYEKGWQEDALSRRHIHNPIIILGPFHIEIKESWILLFVLLHASSFANNLILEEFCLHLHLLLHGEKKYMYKGLDEIVSFT